MCSYPHRECEASCQQSSVGTSSETRKKKSCLMDHGIKKGFFHAPAARPLYVAPPLGALAPGEHYVCDKLLKFMYGTRDAALNWSLECTRTTVRVLPPTEVSVRGSARRRLYLRLGFGNILNGLMCNEHCISRSGATSWERTRR